MLIYFDKSQSTRLTISCFLALVMSFLAGCSDSTNSQQIQNSSVSYLFIQKAQSGSFEELQQDDHVMLTLNGIDPTTIWFTDRPERKTGTEPTGRMLTNFIRPGATPNAALEILNDDGTSEIVVLTLLDYTYNEEDATLTYEAFVIEGNISDTIPAYTSPELNRKVTNGLPEIFADTVIPLSFGRSTLFIDNLGFAPPTCNACCSGTGPDKHYVECTDVPNTRCCDPGNTDCPVEGHDCYLYQGTFYCCLQAPY